MKRKYVIEILIETDEALTIEASNRITRDQLISGEAEAISAAIYEPEEDEA